MKTPATEKLVLASAILALLSLSVMTMSVVSCRGIPADAAMSVGQALGLLSLLLYGWAALRDVKKAKLFGAENETETRGS